MRRRNPEGQSPLTYRRYHRSPLTLRVSAQLSSTPQLGLYSNKPLCFRIYIQTHNLYIFHQSFWLFNFMASAIETLEKKKQHDEFCVEEKTEVKEEKEMEDKVEEEQDRDKEEKEEVKEDEKEGEVVENGKEEADEKVEEDTEVVKKGVSAGKEEETEEKAEGTEEEAEESKKAKRGRKRGSKNVEASSGGGEGGSKKAEEESTAQKKRKTDSSDEEPVTPSERPTRDRKTVERYTESYAGRASVIKPMSIAKGRGTQLKDIPNVAFKLSKKKPDENLQILHSILFGKKAKAHSLKRNIGQFSGYVWVENQEKHRAKVKEKIDKCVKEKLLFFCDILNIPFNKAVIKKEEVSAKLLLFLESPHATTDTLLVDQEKKGKRQREKASKRKSTSSTETSAKKRRRIAQAGEKQKHSSKTEDEDEDEVDNKVEPSANNSDSQYESDNEESDQMEYKSADVGDEEEEEEPKKQMPIEKSSSNKTPRKGSGVISGKNSKSMKKDSPAKSDKSVQKSSSSSLKKCSVDADAAPVFSSKSKVSSTKRQKIERNYEEDQSAFAKEKTSSKKKSKMTSTKVLGKDQGKTSKKYKVEPSNEDMHAVVVDILKEVDFNTATLSDILRQLGTHYGVDLMHRKAEVKAIITDVINMTDEEDEVEDAEAGEDAEKDGDED